MVGFLLNALELTRNPDGFYSGTEVVIYFQRGFFMEIRDAKEIVLLDLFFAGRMSDDDVIRASATFGYLGMI